MAVRSGLGLSPVMADAVRAKGDVRGKWRDLRFAPQESMTTVLAFSAKCHPPLGGPRLSLGVV
jgi:hypothetical protein